MNCLDCGKELSGKRVDARFCDGTCKKRWQRKQKPAGKRGRPKKSKPIAPHTEFTCGECGTKHTGDHDCTKESKPTSIPSESDETFLRYKNAKYEDMVPFPDDSSPVWDKIPAEQASELKKVVKQEQSLAQSVLSRLSTKLLSSAPVVPRGVPILPDKKKGKP